MLGEAVKQYASRMHGAWGCRIALFAGKKLVTTKFVGAEKVDVIIGHPMGNSVPYHAKDPSSSFEGFLAKCINNANHMSFHSHSK
ncbi:hypothetical protein VNO77_43354 [Canavalia gladiata]|uniref:Uncharacterized protein n=1 Tax=Canavalia gladiata TaxID=3824 RepID=A0AAN9PPY9_CANGL